MMMNAAFSVQCKQIRIDENQLPCSLASPHASRRMEKMTAATNANKQKYIYIYIYNKFHFHCRCKKFKIQKKHIYIYIYIYCNTYIITQNLICADLAAPIQCSESRGHRCFDISISQPLEASYIRNAKKLRLLCQAAGSLEPKHNHLYNCL